MSHRLHGLTDEQITDGATAMLIAAAKLDPGGGVWERLKRLWRRHQRRQLDARATAGRPGGETRPAA